MRTVSIINKNHSSSQTSGKHNKIIINMKKRKKI